MYKKTDNITNKDASKSVLKAWKINFMNKTFCEYLIAFYTKHLTI
jgi:hypothetical protein